MRKTLLLRAYGLLTRVALPVAFAVERRKLAQFGTPDARHREKLGHATEPRPDGPLIWFHAASVGESLSVLALISQMAEDLPDCQFLVTSGTPTSAQVVAQRMPPRCRHQFAPLDAPGSVRRFLRHWAPQAAIFVESELWPNILAEASAAAIPLALVNARMSDRSLAGWQKRPRTAAALLGEFRLVLTQTDALAKAMVSLGAPSGRVEKSVNLKAVSNPLPEDRELTDTVRAHLGQRPVWVAASTHPGEEDAVLDAHTTLLAQHPDLCLILAPRHPERANAIAALIAARGWPVSRRSAGEWPTGPVWLADSLGELGSWYTLSPFVFLGGSLQPVGGHNPWEPAQAGAAVLSGPHVTNFSDSFTALTAAGGAVLVDDAADLATNAGVWLNNRDALETARAQASAFCADQSGALEEISAQLADALELRRRG